MRTSLLGMTAGPLALIYRGVEPRGELPNTDN
jgi:hypothetical protein